MLMLNVAFRFTQLYVFNIYRVKERNRKKIKSNNLPIYVLF